MRAEGRKIFWVRSEKGGVAEKGPKIEKNIIAHLYWKFGETNNEPSFGMKKGRFFEILAVFEILRVFDILVFFEVLGVFEGLFVLSFLLF